MKKYLYMLSIMALIISLIVINNTYALLESNANATSNLGIGKWIIKLNNVDISKGYSENFIIDNMIDSENENIEDGYIAPGKSGYFDIVIDPSGTEVAIRYDIQINLESMNLPDNIKLSVNNLSNNTPIKTDNNRYSGIISLDDINKENNITLRLNINWDNSDDNYNDTDTEYGMVQDNNFKIPITINLKQYLGEDIT